jgi:hypothetical protein
VTDFIVYNKAGDILRTGTCVKSDLSLQAQNGEFVIEGEAQDDIHIIVDGKITDKPPPPPPSNEELRIACQMELRLLRNSLLNDSDYTQLPDCALSDSQKKAYKTYRKDLRDLPEKYAEATSIQQVNFPNKP